MTAHETPIDKAKAPDAATVLYVLQQIDAHLTGLQLHHGYPEFLDSDGWQVALERVRHFIAKALDEAQQRCSANPEPRPAIVDKIMRTTGATEAEAYEAAAEGKRIAQAMIAATGTPAKPVPNTIAHLRGWLEAIISDAETVEQKDAFARRALMNEPDPVTELLCPAKASITTDGVEAQITEVISRIALDGEDADALLHALVERVQRDAVITERRRALEMGQPVPCSETARPAVAVDAVVAWLRQWADEAGQFIYQDALRDAADRLENGTWGAELLSSTLQCSQCVPVNGGHVETCPEYQSAFDHPAVRAVDAFWKRQAAAMPEADKAEDEQ